MSMSVSSVGSYSFMDRMVSNSMNRASKSQGKEFDAAEMVSKIIKKEDSSGDGVISANETKLDSDTFGKFDTDGDGSLTSTELQAALENGKPAMGGAQMDPAKMVSKMLEKEDANDDGVLSAEESKMDSELFSKIDTDDDGSLTEDELVAGLEKGGGKRPMGPPPMDTSKMASGIMDSQDTDGDGSLSVEESGLSTDEYSTLDTNQDGKVSIEELQAGLEARHTEMENAMAGQQTGIGSDTDSNDMFQSLLQALAQNQASSAYQTLSETTQTLAVSA